MTSSVQSKDNFGVPTTVGTQIVAPSMDTRPRIRRRMPNAQAPLGPSVTRTTTSSSSTSVRKTPSLLSQPLQGARNIPRSGSGKKTAAQPGHASRRTSNHGNPPRIYPGEAVASDEDQDVRFIDVAGTNSTEHDRGSRMHTARETVAINPVLILEKCQETEPEGVYEVDLHAASVGVIDNLEMFTKLRVLDLSCNHIRQIDNLEYNMDLRELKLYDNDIETIENLERLKELCHLQLQHNRIKAVGKGLQGLRKLRILRLDSNALCRLEVRDVASCSQITSLDLSNNKLDSVSAVSCLTNLEELIVINNRLRTISDLSRCKKLQEVDFSYNRITELSGLKGLPNLTILHASHNQLATLKSLGRLKGLQELNVAGNRLTSAAEVSELCPAIQILELSDNHIEAWDNVCKLRLLGELVELYIVGNPFSSPTGQRPSYHTDLHRVLPRLEILDGAHLKKVTAKSSAPVMRPLSAASVLTSRQVESQLKFLDDEMLSFEKNLSSQFESLRTTMTYLRTEVPSRPVSQTSTSTVSPDNRPTSKCGKRSRIKLAQEFAAAEDIDQRW